MFATAMSGRFANRPYGPRSGHGIKPGASAPGIRQYNNCALEGHRRCSFPPPLQGGFFCLAPELGLKPQPICPPALSGFAAKRRGLPRAFQTLTRTFVADGPQFFASPNIKHILSLVAHKIPHDRESCPPANLSDATSLPCRPPPDAKESFFEAPALISGSLS